MATSCERQAGLRRMVHILGMSGAPVLMLQVLVGVPTQAGSLEQMWLREPKPPNSPHSVSRPRVFLLRSQSNMLPPSFCCSSFLNGVLCTLGGPGQSISSTLPSSHVGPASVCQGLLAGPQLKWVNRSTSAVGPCDPPEQPDGLVWKMTSLRCPKPLQGHKVFF